MADLNSNARTTASDVKEIFDTDLTESELSNWINVAAETTDDIEAADADGSMSQQRLEMIEKQLAAHYASSQDPRIREETVGDAQFKYKGSSKTTDYWRTAVQLDTTGLLTEDGSKPSASISVLDGRGIE